tara:strand:+ start:4663 stop:8181 length:3519 start_codon:yes stop_codon:yes gene_type:complete
MKLRSLRVHGFKSFADSTVIDFHQGITAIVGPNGCGKSNISDAVRWVLGEQRPSAIRGGKMEEGIFQGSLNRRPVNRGSVTMVVSNEDHTLPVAYEEVEIGRTMYRDGGSDYSLNRTNCRLRDVVDLFRDTGLGANAYSVIENRMIDAILSDRTEDRRELFEEASGIGKYKDRRKSALRRLEQAENDLVRLEDVISEVETKVRSLSRQKGKAERYRTLRERRLSVEVAVARNDLIHLEERLQELDTALADDHKTGQGMVAELRVAEATYEKLRLEEITAEHSRLEAASDLDRVKSQLVEWERDLAVAEERKIYAERRLGQIANDRESLSKRLGDVRYELTNIQDNHKRQKDDFEKAQVDLRSQSDKCSAVKNRLQEARKQLEDTEYRERDLVRKGAQLEGDADAAQGQAAELERRIERIIVELGETSNVIADLDSQGDLFMTRFDGFESDAEDSQKQLQTAQESLDSQRKILDEIRHREIDVVRKVQGMKAEVLALESLDLRQEGIDLATKKALTLENMGVVGSLLDFVETSSEIAPLVETYLGIFTQAIVVRDSTSVNRIIDWFTNEWNKEGGLILLPLDKVPDPAGGSLIKSVKSKGEGSSWVEALLGEVDLIDVQGSVEVSTKRSQLSISGVIRDPRGFIKIGRPSGTSGILDRRVRIKSLRQDLSQATNEMVSAKSNVKKQEILVEESESVLISARASFLEVEDRLRRAKSEMEARRDRRSRIDDHRDELTRQLEGAKAARARAQEGEQSAREDRETILNQEGDIQTEHKEAREILSEVQDEWEEARGEETRLSVTLAKVNAEMDRMTERIQDLIRENEVGESRLSDFNAEQEILTGEVSTAQKLQEKGSVTTEMLFRELDQAEKVLENRTNALSDLVKNLADAEKTARLMRTAERESVDRRHQFELEQQDVSRSISLIQERLEREWGRPLDDLIKGVDPVEGNPQDLKEELEDILIKLDRIGLVNMLAVEEHAEESARLGFLNDQREDLASARNDLKSAIRQINETAIDLFESTFEKIRENCKSTFQRLFEGGEADIWLTDPEDPLESPIEIHASPKGKKTQRIDLLSGGERALTALSLLFGIYLVKPSPFCVLDEVDAPLDENNIGRFINLLQEFKEQTQFVVITHNPRSIEAADWIYGVTMEEPGVSKVVGVQLKDALHVAGSTP